MKRQTEVSIQGDKFLINGQATYPGRTWHSYPIEGLLFNTRMVQATFDDLNPETRSLWVYPDTGTWDPERNNREFVAMLPVYRDHGVLGFTVNLQGGSPQGYSKEQPWHNSAITPQGDLRAEYMQRFERIIDQADALGMVVILGIFYFGQAQRMEDEQAIQRAVDHTVEWILEHDYRNVLIEVNNECNVRYTHPILQPERVHELIERVKTHTRNGHRLLVSTSYGGGFVPLPNVVKTADFLLVHGNGISEPEGIAELVRKTRQVEGYQSMPILFNEDDHFNFDQPVNNMIAAIREYASWGYFDFRMTGEGFDEGYQSAPVNWELSSDRKRGFFEKVKEITGY